MTEMTFTASAVREMLARAFAEGFTNGREHGIYGEDPVKFEDSEVLKELRKPCTPTLHFEKTDVYR